MNKLFRFLAFTLLFISGLVLLLWVSGNAHVITAVKKTYLAGQGGVGIYDLDKFPFRTIENIPAKPYEKRQAWKLSEAEQDSLAAYKSIAYLVWQNDTLVQESYFENHAANDVSNSFSVAKSVVSLLAAIAIEQGYITSFDVPVAKYLPQFKNEEIKQLTLAQILGMSTASNWSESGANPFSDNAKAYFGKDLKQLIEAFKITGTPGQEFYYQSGNTQIAAFAIEMAVGMPISQFAQQELWKKIGTESPAYWSLDHPEGHEKAYCCIYATAQDFGRIGQLMLHQGEAKGDTLFSARNYHRLTTPFAPKTWQGVPNKIYGLGWWLDNYRNHEIVYARGILGQYIIVIPSENIVIVRLGHKRGEKLASGHPKDLYTYMDIALDNL